MSTLRGAWSAILGAIVSGVLYFLGFCGFDQWYLSWLCLVPLLIVLDDKTPRQAFFIGWLMGVVTHAGGFYWLIHTISVFGKFPIVLAVGMSAALWIYQGFAMALFAWLVAKLPRESTGLLITAAFLAVEFLYPYLFPSFLGNSQYKVPVLIQTAELGGPLLVSFLVVYANVAIYGLFSIRMGINIFHPYRRFIAAVAMVVAAGVFGTIRMEKIDELIRTSPSMRVGLIQPNMGIYDKRENPGEGQRRHLAGTQALETKGVDLVVWSEAANMYYIDSGISKAPFYGRYGFRTPLLFGTLRRDGEKRFNSAMLTDAQGNILGSYDKHYLLAFGEYIPFGDRFPKLYEYSPNTGFFTKGESLKPLVLNGRRISLMICYEDILPDFVREEVRAGRPNLLVNITNDAWFGKSTEPEIHLALSVFRAVEHRRWLIRATNSGVSAFVDAAGRITSRTNVFEEAILTDKAVLLDLPPTLYNLIGDVLGWAATAAVALGLIVSFFRWILRRRAARLLVRSAS